MSAQVRLCRGVDEFRAACDAVRATGQRLGLVPTMGALHAGHAALMQEARRRADAVAVTIFVNPTQFGPGEDLERYPRDLEGDLARCHQEGVELVFAPDAGEMYPAGERTRVIVSGLADALCGPLRPGHFEGVATIVTKLFAVAGPCVAVFGRKDYQQWRVIERMTRDLLLPVQVVGLSTVREGDGLALSSRNRYLSAAERQQALGVPRALAAAARSFAAGERRVAELRIEAQRALAAAGLRVEYVTLADAEALRPVADAELVEARALLAVAVRCGSARLIDNLVLGEEAGPDVPVAEALAPLEPGGGASLEGGPFGAVSSGAVFSGVGRSGAGS